MHSTLRAVWIPVKNGCFFRFVKKVLKHQPKWVSAFFIYTLVNKLWYVLKMTLFFRKNDISRSNFHILTTCIKFPQKKIFRSIFKCLKIGDWQMFTLEIIFLWQKWLFCNLKSQFVIWKVEPSFLTALTTLPECSSKRKGNDGN